jgi:hypothetical protein
LPRNEEVCRLDHEVVVPICFADWTDYYTGSAPGLYSVYNCFESLSTIRLVWQTVIVIFLRLCRQIPEYYLEIIHIYSSFVLGLIFSFYSMPYSIDNVTDPWRSLITNFC